MRRGVTVLVVVVVAAIALAAGFDALRGEDSPQAGSEPEPETPSVSTTAPEGPTNYVPLEAELAGTLYYTDESCELQAIQLPDSVPAEAPNWDECRFVLSPNGRRVSGPGSGWDPYSDPLIGRLFQTQGGRIQVSTNHGPEGRPFSGLAPAWRPDGTLTYFEQGAVREWPSGEVALSQQVLLQAIAQNEIVPLGNRFRAVVVREAAWLDDRRLVAVISALERNGPGQDLLAVYYGQRLTGLGFDELGGMGDLRVSPAGHFAAARVSGRRGQGELLVVNTANGLARDQAVFDYRGIAWSPDDRWTAIATAVGVSFFRSGVEGPPELELELDAQDLAWRGETGPPPLPETEEVRDWLEGVDGGRLFLTDSDCRLRALRVPDLIWEEEPDAAAPCTFTLGPRGTAVDKSISVSPTSELRATCQGGSLRVFDDAGLRAELVNACAPAWMGDGTLTFIRNGGLWQGMDDEEPLILREQVSELFGRPSALEEVAWVDDERFWAVVRSGQGATLALLTTDRLVSSPSFTTQAIEDLRVNATGLLAARSDQGVVFLDSRGERAMTFPNGRVVAWAPGELIAAVATPSEVLFVAPLSREVVTLPLAVKDLEWVVP